VKLVAHVCGFILIPIICWLIRMETARRPHNSRLDSAKLIPLYTSPKILKNQQLRFPATSLISLSFFDLCITQCAKLQATFGLQLPAWQQGVDRMLAEIL